MEFRVLGKLEVVRDGHPVDLGAFRQRALLGLLLTSPNSVFSTDQILEGLWGQDAAADKQSSLWVYVSALRTALEPDRAKRSEGTILLTRAPGYLVEIAPDHIDSVRFERLVAQGRALAETDPAAASLVLREALALWRGRAFEDFTYESFARGEIARLEEMRLEAVEARVDADLWRGMSRELVPELESLVRQHPLQEHLTGQFMVALYRSGRQADALRAYQFLKTGLGEELGLKPSATLRRLHEQIVTGDDAFAGVTRSSSVSSSGLAVDVAPGNLPVQDSSFVGRDDAIAEIVDAVGEHRVVTLIGVGGVGKTRLALQTAAILAPRFRDGVWFIELAPVTDGAGVDGAVASVFMLQPQPERTWRQVVVDALQGREVLLVIDNCEHVLDETAGLVEALAACASVRVMVTSRESLAVRGEWAWRVPSLTGAAAVELFIERATPTASGFAPNDADLVVIGEICERLDGIALAIELAASRVQAMSPTQIRDRLGERFRLLTGSRRSIERHQTLRHAVQWSYDLLEPIEQTVLRQVSVFVGGFSLESANAVTGLDEFDVIDIVESLVRKSLLHVERGDGEVRYGTLETIRQFAEEALAGTDTADDIRDRHAQYFADQSDIAFERFTTEDERLAYRFVDSEITNLTTAFHWALTRELTDPAARIAANTHLIARNRLQTETYAWPEQALDLARRTGHRQLAHLLASACDAANCVGRFDDAIGYGLEAITLNDDVRYNLTIHAYWATGLALFTAGDVEHALPVLRAGAAHPADAPARINLFYLHVLAYFGGLAMSQPETIEAIEHLKASSMPTIRAGGLWVQALATADDDPPAAIALCQQALDANTGSRTREASVRGYQLGLISQTDDVEAALTGFTHVIDTFQATMGDGYTRNGMSNLVAWLARLGYHDGAARLSGAVEVGRHESWSYHPEVLELREIMGEEAFSAASQAGAVLSARATGELAHQLLAQVRADRLGA